MLIDVNSLKAELRNSIVEVIFTKENGETRRMRATLQPRHIPQEAHGVINDTQQLLNEDEDPSKNIVVWDVDVNGWRSFRSDRIISVQGVNTW